VDGDVTGGVLGAVQGSPVKRAKRRGVLQNVEVALGELEVKRVPALAAALHDEEPLVRGHAAWGAGADRGGGGTCGVAGAGGREAVGWVARRPVSP
jgi:epoxyqueuosine reductase